VGEKVRSPMGYKTRKRRPSVDRLYLSGKDKGVSESGRGKIRLPVVEAGGGT